MLARLSAFGTVGSWGSDDDYTKVELFLMAAKTFDRHALQVAAYHGDTLGGGLPPYDPFLLGGFLRGSGYRMDELVGSRVALGRTVYSYKFAALPPPLGRGLYLGASLEATWASLGVDLESDGKVRPSGSLFLGADTFLGPAYIGWGQAFSGDQPGAPYLLLGTP